MTDSPRPLEYEPQFEPDPSGKPWLAVAALLSLSSGIVLLTGGLLFTVAAAYTLAPALAGVKVTLAGAGLCIIGAILKYMNARL